ncbi:hypothetical protein EJ07DRAFT_160462 [Lizonia empirigonia]|nr:hypothetical protein EJ07DRAFT_160462 [Lizonia empirigonia]
MMFVPLAFFCSWDRRYKVNLGAEWLFGPWIALAPHRCAKTSTPQKKFEEERTIFVQSTSATTTMNAEAYLRKQGWQALVTPLDCEGRGIKKPLLIAHKQDQLGLERRRRLTRPTTSGGCSTLSQDSEEGINRGGLYGFFVRGESIAGTLGDSDSSAAPTDASAAPSGTSTPATSASDSEAVKKAADKKSKRKREAGRERARNKKANEQEGRDIWRPRSEEAGKENFKNSALTRGHHTRSAQPPRARHLKCTIATSSRSCPQCSPLQLDAHAQNPGATILQQFGGLRKGSYKQQRDALSGKR